MNEEDVKDGNCNPRIKQTPVFDGAERKGHQHIVISLPLQSHSVSTRGNTDKYKMEAMHVDVKSDDHPCCLHILYESNGQIAA